MRVLVFTVLISFLALTCDGQNLVPNSSFENTNELPCEYTGLAQDFDSIIYDWTLPHTGTSDIYSYEVDVFCVSHCESKAFGRMGSEKPHSGTKMAGFFAYSGSFVYREYLQVKLKCPLVPGKRYYAEMYVSHADETQYSCNNIGMTFRDDIFKNYMIGGELGFTPVVESAGIVSNDTGWVKISGEFIAKSSSEYLIIGNFSNNINTQTIKDPSKGTAMGYYYIDDILVKPLSTTSNRTIDTSICESHNLQLYADLSCFIGWATSDQPDVIISTEPGLLVTPSSDITYFAYGVTDTLIYNISISALPHIQFDYDTLFLCKGQKEKIEFYTDDVTYLWQDGSNDASYTFSTPGLYWLQVENSCGTSRDTLHVKGKNCACSVYTPSAFTPGNNGLNDSFAPVIDCDLEHYQLSIYNRWGEKIFSSHQYDQKWGGTYRNEPVPGGSYLWILEYTSKLSGVRYFTSGTVTLLR